MYPSLNTAPAQVSFGWIGESWRLFRAQWPTWAAVALIYNLINWGVLYAAASMLGMVDQWKFIIAHIHDPTALSGPSAPHSDPISSLLFDVVVWVISAFFYGGLFRMSNRQVRGEPIGVGDLFKGGPTFLTMLGYVIVFGLISTFGSCLLCVGALVVYALLFPAFALIADGASFGDAFTRSFEGMKQDWFRASLYVLVFSLILLLGIIPLVFLITTPMTYLSTSLAYRDMIGMSGPSGGSAGFYPTQGPPGAWPASPTPPTGSDAPPSQAPPDEAPPPSQNT